MNFGDVWVIGFVDVSVTWVISTTLCCCVVLTSVNQIIQVKVCYLQKYLICYQGTAVLTAFMFTDFT